MCIDELEAAPTIGRALDASNPPRTTSGPTATELVRMEQSRVFDLGLKEDLHSLDGCTACVPQLLELSQRSHPRWWSDPPAALTEDSSVFLG
ncbi:MAG: hypothetical protein IT449_12015 [Phycisphaerales bacterium]|nr:hypothetical protein [Phycisphaerales bacterium]